MTVSKKQSKMLMSLTSNPVRSLLSYEEPQFWPGTGVTSVIPGAEMGRITVQSQSKQKVREIPSHSIKSW
jgi:hypothetical protein